ncbi:MAG: DUF6787 family protein [Bacteroidota bacterium]
MKAKSSRKVLDIVVILLIFSITGSTAAILPKYLMPLLGLEKGTFQYVLGYILVITPIYQVLLLVYAFLFGKFSYFYEKQKKLGNWILKKFRISSTPKQDSEPNT